MPNPLTTTFLPDQESQINLLKSAYKAFNSCDINMATDLMSFDVMWPRAFQGGYASGPEAVCAYWTGQWNEINPQVKPLSFHFDSSGQILVKVHQIVKSLEGELIAENIIGHCFTIDDGLIQRMDIYEV